MFRKFISRLKRGNAVALVIALVATVVGVGLFASSATATGDKPPPPPPEGVVCTDLYKRVIHTSHLEFKLEKTEYQYAKHTRTKTRTWVEGTPATPDRWWVWSPNDSQGPQDYEPAFPEDERGTWQGPKENGGPEQGTYGTFKTGSPGNSNWFHREKGDEGTDGYWTEWSEWSAWTVWKPLSHVTWEDFNVDSIGPVAKHGSGTYADGTEWYREWQVRNTHETRQVKYKDGAWTTDTPGDPWVVVKQRTVKDKPIVQVVRSSETPPLDYDGVNSDVPWKKIPGTQECDVQVPEPPRVENPCGPDNATWIKPDDGEVFLWDVNDEGELIVTIADSLVNQGYRFPDKSISFNYGTAPDDNEPCPPVNQCPDGSNPGDANGDNVINEEDCNYTPPPTDACPDLPGNQPEGTNCVTKDPPFEPPVKNPPPKTHNPGPAPTPAGGRGDFGAGDGSAYNQALAGAGGVALALAGVAFIIGLGRREDAIEG